MDVQEGGGSDRANGGLRDVGEDGVPRWNMQSMLRQMVYFMESRNERMQYETANSKYTHHLLKAASRSSDNTLPGIRKVPKEILETGNMSQMIGSILE